MWRILLMVAVLLWTTQAGAQRIGGVGRVDPLRAPVADKVRTVLKAQPVRKVFKADPLYKVFRAQPLYPVVKHLAKATVKAAVLTHNYRTTAHERWCMMCLGQHLRNFHGKTYDELDAIGYKNWVRYHEGLHDAGVYKKSAGCVDGSCSTDGNHRLLRRFRR